MLPDARVIAVGGALASVFFGACVVAPSTRTTEPPRDAHVARDLPNDIGSPSVLSEFSADPPGEPVRGVEEILAPRAPPPKAHVRSFTRRIDRARVEARGAARMKAGLSDAVLQAAVTFDNQQWTTDQRRDLLAYLRADMLAKDTAFTAADARIIAQIQAGSGALADGQLRDETMAVLFAMGFRFSPRKATPWEVKLDFYPGEVEDLDAWNREVDTKVTKNGGGFRDLSAPDGEGTIYVYVGRSIVAGFRARGGPPFPVNDDGEHVAGPTKPGLYRLGTAHAHVTSNWYFSQIPWGAEIRKSGDGYQYRWPGRSEWSWATSNPAGTLKLPLAIDVFDGLPQVTRDGVIYMFWNKNDFGPLAWNLVPSDMYIHTTPDAEAKADADAAAPNTDASLPVSHGCIHIYPYERDEMMKWGYLGTNVLFVVRRWEEHLLPDEVRHEMLGR